MTCPRERLEALVYGELTSAQAVEVERHAAGCDDCAAELAWLRTERAALRERADREPELPAALWEGIEQRISGDDAEAAGDPWWRVLWPWRKEQMRWFGFGLATATAAAAAVFVLSTPNGADQPTVARVDADAAVVDTDAAATELTPADKMAEAQRAVDEAEAAHLAAISALEAAYLDKRDQLEPAVAARYDEQFRKTRATIDAARADAGDDIVARVQLLDAYSAHRRAIQSVVYGVEETSR